MRSTALIQVLVYHFLLMVAAISMTGCEKEPQANICVKGKVIGQGCLTGSYAIMLEGKNADYGIAESIAYDNVVETLNLPDEYKINGSVIYFTFTKPVEELGKYLTYCTSAPQIVLHNISDTECPVSLHAQQVSEVSE
ncbi:hypothetical protein Q0590_02175 [Rhodocytophaga aerolata]|uniref:Uncharacterized protein n=1 Tax=Rhodocytophaga aerolata TaxID=455078 RepID=A0ABT8QYW6_9BACT|nr:hypothetical protein [Rhodocytophaga aerolata]MDO1445035.1 hypothetical protein [Rhodocytophaga aerolata]